MSELTVDRDGHVVLVRLNRPPRNTMSVGLLEEFHETIGALRHDATARALVLGSIGKHFCAGADVGTGLPGSEQAVRGPMGQADQLRDVYAPFLSLLDLPIPTVAAVRGAAVGGGFGLALACDFRVVSPESRFIAPFVKLGLHPGMGLTYLLPALVGIPRALELLLTGDELRGEMALQWGLANRCVPDEDVEDEALALAQQLAAGAPGVVRWTRRSVYRHAGFDPRMAAEVESMAQALSFQGQDAAEGARAFLEKRAPVFRGE